ncbi:Zn-ribbon domain-containing OB-fold protein [Bacillus salipaludis]|uniref:Zn-ribbon domain-containing OB-fold protein n=1 Tax=Bacillus salipaludis TaxID=2547811 RepID=A0ABW8RN99_9BACI
MDKFENLKVPGPTVTPVSKPFWEAVANHKLILQKCTDCNKWVFYPRMHCSHCWSGNLVWEQVSGKARLKTWSVVHRSGHPGWEEITPFVLGVVELEEGPSMMSHLLLKPFEDLQIGLPLVVRYIRCNDVWLPFFERCK